MMMTIVKSLKRITKYIILTLNYTQMKNSIKTSIFLVMMFTLFFTIDVFAQQAPVAKVIVNRIIDKALTDSGLINKKIRFTEDTFPPGYADTISHRHAAEVFIYVVEGTMEHRMGKNESVIYKQGQIVHEPPYSLHTLLKNPSTTEPLKVLLTFLYTDGPGAPKTIREYPVKKK
jgi:quercetin dioxygenase-like cupin family protein